MNISYILSRPEFFGAIGFILFMIGFIVQCVAHHTERGSLMITARKFNIAALMPSIICLVLTLKS